MENRFMMMAFREAELACKEDEVPVGCVIVKNDEVIAKAHNMKEKRKSAIFHAEIECINKATEVLGNWYLDDCEIYVTLEPCIMCAGAIINSRIKKVYIGASDPKGGAFGSNIDITQIKGLNHYPEYEKGIMEEECSDILKLFFKGKRKKA